MLLAGVRNGKHQAEFLATSTQREAGTILLSMALRAQESRPLRGLLIAWHVCAQKFKIACAMRAAAREDLQELSESWSKRGAARQWAKFFESILPRLCLKALSEWRCCATRAKTTLAMQYVMAHSEGVQDQLRARMQLLGSCAVKKVLRRCKQHWMRQRVSQWRVSSALQQGQRGMHSADEMSWAITSFEMYHASRNLRKVLDSWRVLYLARLVRSWWRNAEGQLVGFLRDREESHDAVAVELMAQLASSGSASQTQISALQQQLARWQQAQVEWQSEKQRLEDRVDQINLELATADADRHALQSALEIEYADQQRNWQESSVPDPLDMVGHWKEVDEARTSTRISIGAQMFQRIDQKFVRFQILKTLEGWHGNFLSECVFS